MFRCWVVGFPCFHLVKAAQFMEMMQRLSPIRAGPGRPTWSWSTTQQPMGGAGCIIWENMRISTLGSNPCLSCLVPCCNCLFMIFPFTDDQSLGDAQ